MSIRKRSGGRVTPKGTGVPSRYTPPVPKESKTSPRWLVVLMFAFLVVGFLIIVLNYLPGSPLLPGPSSNRNLLIGLGSITLGFFTATRYR